MKELFSKFSCLNYFKSLNLQ